MGQGQHPLAGRPGRRLRAAVLTSYPPVCVLCGDDIDLSLRYPDPMSPSADHVIPTAHGGPNTIANLRPSHLRCNLAKGATTRKRKASRAW